VESCVESEYYLDILFVKLKGLKTLYLAGFGLLLPFFGLLAEGTDDGKCLPDLGVGIFNALSNFGRVSLRMLVP
jgi:hypothetical protein